MKVTSIFYSVQGEGQSLGQPSVFLRLNGCNLRCKWCDTKYTWAESDGKDMNISEIAFGEIKKYPTANRLVITGGEPLMQADEVERLINVLREQKDWWVEIETNGTISPTFNSPNLWTVAPKLSNSGVPDFKRKIKQSWWDYSSTGKLIVYKFVVNDPEDSWEIFEFQHKHGIPSEKIYVMPECITVEKHNENLLLAIEMAKNNGWRVTPRLHILAWGNIRGV